jgi:hypothetical protein
MLENDQDFNCPYCAEVISMRIDQTGGSKQFFTIDCEVCCQPIAVEVTIEPDGYIDFVVKREGEG